MSNCKFGGRYLCVWEKYEEQVIQETEDNLNTDPTIVGQMKVITNNFKRKKAYQIFVSCKYGRTNGKRVRLPGCVLNGIRSHYPSENGMYMGHKDE